MPEIRRNVTLLLLGIVAALAVLLYVGAYLLTEWWWFDAVGFRGVFAASLVSRVAVGGIAATAFGLILGANLWIAKGRHWPAVFSLTAGVPTSGGFGPPGGSATGLTLRRVNQLVLLAAVVFGALAGWYTSDAWLVVRLFLAQVPFGGTPDPVFGKDAAFYVFTLPFLGLVYEFALAAVVVSALGSGLVYVANRGIRYDYGRLELDPKVRAHLSALAAAFFVVKAYGYGLALYQILYSSRGVTFGASYTDVYASAPAYRILGGLSLVLAGAMLYNLRARRLGWLAGGFGVLLAAAILLGSVWPGFVEQFVVEPDQLAKETPYIEHNIAFTRRAFGLDAIEEREFPARADLTAEGLNRNKPTLDNVRLWEEVPLLSTYGQLQALRLYYDFHSVDVDRYTLNGVYRQVQLSVRELNKQAIEAGAQTWVNLKLIFTHGYGLVMSPANAVTPEGLPVLFVRDFPPRSAVDLQITRPEIYYGELTDDYVIVNTRRPEFDYPQGEDNAFTHYSGSGGVRLASAFHKYAFALRHRSYQMVINQDITPDSRMLMYRNVVQRARHIAPFLRYDRDPYIVVGDDGRLFWILDAYTTTRGMPYAEPHRSGVNYIRNAVKVVIDAYDGSVAFYWFDPDDPLAKTLDRVFPGWLQPREAMRPDLARHVRYPQDLFRIQAEMYLKYHMTNPTTFYNSEDLWSLPDELSPIAAQASSLLLEGRRVMEPYYTITRLPGEAREEFVLMVPFTPIKKNNMVSFLVARNDGEHYGRLIDFRLPKDRLVYGPVQINSRIDQDPIISQNLTLWSQQGSNVLRGRVQVIPVEESILYVQPLYLQATASALPEFRRAIVVFGSEQVAMEPTLDAALRAIFGRTAVPVSGDGEPGEPAVDLVQRARELYREAQRAAQAGDWAGFGQALQELGRVLDRLAARDREAGEGTEP